MNDAGSDARDAQDVAEKTAPPGPNDYVIRVRDDLSSIDPRQWNALLEARPDATPFMRHEYLLALTVSGSAAANTGWQPQFLTVHEGDALIAACPLYLKHHSYGE
ncbi:MAG TPA: peptidogalycan biosysnthesis protein, partial [Burkholderiaceae bacterium]|nr:peptidogalycan biosysnthesis protein [Burkholderiaceae bacterium]